MCFKPAGQIHGTDFKMTGSVFVCLLAFSFFSIRKVDIESVRLSRLCGP